MPIQTGSAISADDRRHVRHDRGGHVGLVHGIDVYVADVVGEQVQNE